MSPTTALAFAAGYALALLVMGRPMHRRRLRPRQLRFQQPWHPRLVHPN